MLQFAEAPAPSSVPEMVAVPLLVKEMEFAMVTVLLKFTIAPAAIDDALLIETAPEKVIEVLKVKFPLIATGPAMVKAAVPPKFEVLFKVTAPVPVLLNVPAFEIPPPKI